MRLLIQGCLILWLCFFSSSVFSDALFGYAPNDVTFPSVQAACQAYGSANSGWSYKSETKTTGNPVSTSVTQWGFCTLQFANQTWNLTDQNIYWKSAPPPECVSLSHEPNPITGEIGSTNESDCSCASGWETSGGVPGENSFDCVIPDQPQDQCVENGQLYDPEAGYCVLDCPNGFLNGVCIPEPEPDTECTKGSPNYRGQLVLGYGKPVVNVCANFDQCTGGKPGQVGYMNGELRCISEDYGIPKCGSDAIATVDGYGFACSTLANKPDQQQNLDQPNTDTDGDGIPDEYQRKNDAESLDKGLDKIADKIDQGNSKADQSNQHLSKIANTLKDIANSTSSLEQMGKNGELAGGRRWLRYRACRFRRQRLPR